MSQKDYLRDISEIKTLMSKSSKFISLSGLSGILAGVYSLLGAGYYFFGIKSEDDFSSSIIPITVIVLIVFFATTITTVFFTSKRSKITGEKIWGDSTKNLIVSFSTTFYIGVICILILYFKEEYTYLLALLILFYGIAIINASRHTNVIIQPLGFIEVVIGLLCIIYPEFSLWFCILGFGIIHIIYGSIFYFKYDKK
ncbi:MAG: hypothetical protein AB8B78_10950 [Polaribacter sp.]